MFLRPRVLRLSIGLSSLDATHRFPVPFLTPDESPNQYIPVVFWLPADTNGDILVDFDAIVSGLLLDLIAEANFEQYGTLTPTETAEVFRNVFDLTIPWQLV